MMVFIKFCLTCGRQLFPYEVTGHRLGEHVVVGLWEEDMETVAIGVPEEQES